MCVVPKLCKPTMPHSRKTGQIVHLPSVGKVCIHLIAWSITDDQKDFMVQS